MKALATSLFAALVLVPRAALADEPITEAPAPGDGVPRQEVDVWQLPAPSVGGGFALAFGLDGVSSGWSDWLARAQRPDVVGVMGDIGARAFIQFEGLELSLNANLLFNDNEGSEEPATTGMAGTVFAELSYDAARSLFLTIGPTFGVGWLRSSFCVSGDATPVPASASTFRQVLAAPGRQGSCLSADALLFRPGVVVGVALPLMGVPDGNVGFFNVKPSYSFVAQQTEYTADGHKPFAGPTLPHPAFGVTFEVGFTFGEGYRTTGL
jgi:hypothetical protein